MSVRRDTGWLVAYWVKKASICSRTLAAVSKQVGVMISARIQAQVASFGLKSGL